MKSRHFALGCLLIFGLPWRAAATDVAFDAADSFAQCAGVAKAIAENSAKIGLPALAAENNQIATTFVDAAEYLLVISGNPDKPLAERMKDIEPYVARHVEIGRVSFLAMIEREKSEEIKARRDTCQRYLGHATKTLSDAERRMLSK